MTYESTVVKYVSPILFGCGGGWKYSRLGAQFHATTGAVEQRGSNGREAPSVAPLRGWEVYAPHYVRLGKLSNVLPSAEHDPAHAKRQRKAHSRDNKAPKVVQRVIVRTRTGLSPKRGRFVHHLRPR